MDEYSATPVSLSHHQAVRKYLSVGGSVPRAFRSMTSTRTERGGRPNHFPHAPSCVCFFSIQNRREL